MNFISISDFLGLLTGPAYLSRSTFTVTTSDSCLERLNFQIPCNPTTTADCHMLCSTKKTLNEGEKACRFIAFFL